MSETPLPDLFNPFEDGFSSLGAVIQKNPKECNLIRIISDRLTRQHTFPPGQSANSEG